TGVNNQTVVNQVTASPIWDGIPDPLNLTLNSGLVTSTIGLHATASGQVLGRFANGDDALIIGNNAHTILSGFEPYLANDVPSRVRLTQNELHFLLSRPDPADFHKLTLAHGATLQAKALLPGPPDGAMEDSLQPELRLYSSRELLASGGPGMLLNYTVPSGGAGTYYVEVLPSPQTPTPTQGDFVLGVQ